MQSQFSERLNWIDALRGFTMFSVVLVHVLVRSFGVNESQSALCILRGSFTLPLFFLVSGFFLCRPISEWTRPRILNALRVRSLALLGGTIVVSTIYFSILTKNDPFLWLPYAGFDLYWFTISLFQMFIAYLLAVGLAKLTRPWVLWTIAAAAAVASLVWIVFHSDLFWNSWLYSSKTWEYTPFFVIGMLIRRFSHKAFRLFSNPWTLAILLLTFLGSIFIGYIGARRFEALLSHHVIVLFTKVFSRVSGALLVMNIFYIYRDFFNRDSGFVRLWRLIGRRTLDIYYLHYFLLPWMRWVGPYLKTNNTIIQELTAGGIVAFAVILCCLGMSAIFRRCPGIRCLFGAKGPIKPQAYA